jgi:hypothetical protein
VPEGAAGGLHRGAQDSPGVGTGEVSRSRQHGIVDEHAFKVAVPDDIAMSPR